MPNPPPKRDRFFIKLYSDILLVGILSAGLIIQYLKIIKIPIFFFEIVSIAAVIPVVVSAVKAIPKRELTIDLLASIALVFSFIAGEWYSAAFINLMLASARIFEHWTERRTKILLNTF